MMHTNAKAHKKSWPLWRMLFSRTTILLVFLIVQILSLWAMFTYLNEKLTFGFFVVLSALEVLFLLNRRGNTAYKLSWIVPIVVFPVFGALFYLFLNLQTAVKRMRFRFGEEEKESRVCLVQKQELWDEMYRADPQLYGISRYLYDIGGYPSYDNTSVQYFWSGESVFPVLVNELKKAKRFIFMEFFIVAKGEIWDEVLAVLKQKAAEGVEVRFLYDGMNTISNLPFSYNNRLQECGIATKVFSPIVPALASYQNNRDHRKICVIDGNTAFTGGFNLADEYANKIVRFGYWKDSGIMLKGEAVNSMTQLFLQMWNGVYGRRQSSSERLDYGKYKFAACEDCSDDLCGRDGLVIPYGDNPLDNENLGENVYLDILYSARDYVHIMTPYLVLDDQMMNALCFAAKRGVGVKILFPHVPDKAYAFWLAHSYYRELLESGVRIFEYKPGFVHAKEFISDDSKAVVGTINLDFRSLYLHFENAVYLHSVPAILDMEADFETCLADCIEVDTAYLEKLPWYKMLFGHALRLFAPLF